MNRFYHNTGKPRRITSRWFILFVYFFLAGPFPLSARLPEYQLQLFDYTSGIQPGAILSVGKDTRGFLWILYQRQVQRFDGRQVTTYKLKQNLNHLLCDKYGNIWVSSYDKVFRYADGHQGFKEVPLQTNEKSNQFGAIFAMPGKKIWLNTYQGFYEYNPASQSFEPITPRLPLAPPHSIRVFAHFGNTLFIRHGRFFYRCKPGTQELDSLPELNINKALPLNEDSVLVSTWDNKSFWFDFRHGETSPVYAPSTAKAGQNNFLNVRSLAEISAGRFLVAAREGIFEYDRQAKHFQLQQFYLDGRKVSTNDYANQIILDGEGYAWMATIDGVARFSVRGSFIGMLRLRQPNDVLPAGVDNVRKLVEDEQGNMWLATNYGVACLQKENRDWKFYLPVTGRKDGLAHPSVRGLVSDGKYMIIAPTDLGIWLLDPKTGKYKRPNYADPQVKQRSERDFYSHILTLHNGDHFFAARDAVYVMDGKTYTLRLLRMPPGARNTSGAFQQGNDVVWLTTGGGLHCLDSGLNYLQEVTLPFKNEPVVSGFALPGNRLLFSSSEGLFRAEYKNGAVTVKKLTPLFDNILLATLYQDKNGIIWATSENGIYRFDPLTSKLNLFDHADNVQGYGFNYNSWMLGRDGNLYFGGTNGINYLQPGPYTKPEEPLNVYIQKVRIGNMDSFYYAFDKEPELKYSQRSLEIEFVTPYFNNPQKVKYRYQLRGYDDTWNPAGNNNQLRFTSLSPGKYQLLVQASLNNVDWVDARDLFSFRIASPFWSSWWFVALCALGMALLIYLFIRIRNKKLQEKLEKLETEQAISYFASSMSEQQNVDDILWDVARNCIGKLQFEDCVIYLLDEERGVLVQKAAHGPKSPRHYQINKPLDIPLGKGIVGAVAASGRAEIIRDTTKDPRYLVDDEQRFAEIAVPVKSDGKVLGVIDCEHSKKNFFTQKHLSILSTIASLCANKIVRVRAEEEKQRAQRTLMETQQKMTEVEMQALRAQMNPHFIFNSLNSINRYIVKSDQVTASLYLTKFAKLIRLILDNSNSKNIMLTNELEALKLYIEMEALRFDKKFAYRIDVEPGLGTDCVEVPPLIIQPYVENAIWHGLLHKETPGCLCISVSMPEENLLQCIIEDDGVGRERARELKSKTATTRKSLGMKLTENRLSLLNKYAELNASIDIIDLENGDGQAAGTRVILQIPV